MQVSNFFGMESDGQLLLAEQQKTNQLLSQMIADSHIKERHERRRFWISFFWQILPLLISLLLIGYVYYFVHNQITALQTKVSNTFDVSTISDRLRSLIP